MVQRIGSFARISNFHWEKIYMGFRANQRKGFRQPEKSGDLEMGRKCSSSIIFMLLFFFSSIHLNYISQMLCS